MAYAERWHQNVVWGGESCGIAGGRRCVVFPQGYVMITDCDEL